MKNTQKIISISLIALISVLLYSFDYESEPKDALNYNCYVSNNYSTSEYTIETVVGDACGSDRSLKIYYTNHRNYAVRVAFYMPDENGQYSQYHPYTVTVKPGTRVYHHKCNSNMRYEILVAKSGSGCTFPKYGN